ncbi:F-box protein [Phanerochaete sordida]|uniref:F-box protein n=1 Tax=Phanerochaete sordida TaxID=48140 RepID=A0A9P3G388_9APHY|nr:F-box protein [Phanerochaete sordida]
MAKRPRSLADLHVEIIGHILTYLPIPDIARCERVSRVFLSTFDTYPLLRFRVACFLAGVVQGPAARGLPLCPDRTIELERWKSLQRKGLHSENAPTETLPGISHRIVAGGPAYCELLARRVTVIQPASERTRKQARRWTLPPLEFDPWGLACDHSQRLLIFLVPALVAREWSIHVRSSETGKPHPSALNTRYTVERCPPPASSNNMQLLIYGPMLVITSQISRRGSRGYIVRCCVLDWKSGLSLLDTSSVSAGGLSVCEQSVVPLDAEHIIFPIYSHPNSTRTECVAVYNIDRRPRKEGSLQDAYDDAELILELPPIHDQATCKSVQIPCAPAPLVTSQDDSHAVFLKDPGASIIAITLSITAGYDLARRHQTSVTLVIRADTIWRLLEQRSASPSPSCPSSTGGPMVFPWDSWKANAAALQDLDSVFVSSSRLFVHTSRRAPETGRLAPLILDSYDFNCCTTVDESQASVHSGATVKNPYLKEDLVSRLPYRLTSTIMSAPPGEREPYPRYQAHGDDYVVVHSIRAGSVLALLTMSQTYFL